MSTAVFALDGAGTELGRRRQELLLQLGGRLEAWRPRAHRGGQGRGLPQHMPSCQPRTARTRRAPFLWGLYWCSAMTNTAMPLPRLRSPHAQRHGCAHVGVLGPSGLLSASLRALPHLWVFLGPEKCMCSGGRPLEGVRTTARVSSCARGRWRAMLVRGPDWKAATCSARVRSPLPPCGPQGGL